MMVCGGRIAAAVDDKLEEGRNCRISCRRLGTKPLFMAKHLYIAVGEVHIRGGGGKIAKGSILFVFFIPIQSSLLSPIQKLAENDLYCVSRELTY